MSILKSRFFEELVLILCARSIVDELKPDFVNVGTNSREPECVSLAWSADGQTLFGGFTDDVTRVWSVVGS